jgi:hypothetical protein
LDDPRPTGPAAPRLLRRRSGHGRRRGARSRARPFACSCLTAAARL